MAEEIVVLVTTPSPEEAARIGQHLVEKGLVACVNIVPQVRSFFFWEGKVCDEKEALLLAKTRAALFETVEQEVKALHSYAVPEVIALPILTGSREYLKWVHEVTKK